MERQEADVQELPRGWETILLVEDEPAIRELSSRLLREKGYTVLEAANGAEALAVAGDHAETTIHLLLTDVMMPELLGDLLAKRLRALRPGLKVLFISGYTDANVISNGQLDSEAAFLQKPFSASELVHKAHELLRLRAS